MKKSVRSPGSATVINAIATGFGAAFGIGLDIKCCANTQNSSITCSNDVGAPTTLMEICAKKTFEKYDITHVILSKKSKLNMLINKNDKYNRIYSDDYFVIYERNK